MNRRPTILVPLALVFVAAVAGCTSESVTTPKAGEISQYLQNNPDAPVSSSVEPEGVNGPGTVGQ